MAKDNKSDITPEEIEALEPWMKTFLNKTIEFYTEDKASKYYSKDYTGTKIGARIASAAATISGRKNNDEVSLIQSHRWIKYIADQILETQLKEANGDLAKMDIAKRNYVKFLGGHPVAKEKLRTQLREALKSNDINLSPSLTQLKKAIDSRDVDKKNTAIHSLATLLCPNDENKQRRLKQFMLNDVNKKKKTWYGDLSSWIKDVLNGFRKTEAIARDAEKIVQIAQSGMVKADRRGEVQGVKPQIIASSPLKR